MRSIKLFAVLLMAVVCVGLSSCSKDDEHQDKNNTIEKYSTLLYGSWYGEVNFELSKTFMSYKFSTNKSVVRYIKSCSRTKSIMDGNTTYSEWIVINEYSTSGLWYIEQRDKLNYLKIQWNRNDFYSGYLIAHLDANLLNFGDTYDTDLTKGDKTPNF